MRTPLTNKNLDKNEGECLICYDDLEAGEKIARLPCLCIYHVHCIDAWFKKKGKNSGLFSVDSLYAYFPLKTSLFTDKHDGFLLVIDFLKESSVFFLAQSYRVDE